MTAFIALAATALVGNADPDVNDIIQTKFEDAQYTLKIVDAKFAELAKVDDDYTAQYRFKEAKVAMKDPLKLRVEATIQDATVVTLYNGYELTYRIPRNNLKTTQNLQKSIGRLTTTMELGSILTPVLMKDIFDAKYVRTDRATGNYVFDLTYKKKYDNTTRHRIWVDPQKRYITKREWWGQGSNPRLKAIISYEDPIGRDGVWLPTKATARNVDNKVAGITQCVDVKINQGIPDSVFTK